MSGSDDNGIKVFARIRPCGKESTLEWDDKTLANVGYMQHRKDRVQIDYEFTQVFDPTRSNTDVFDTMVKPLTTRVRNGYNALVVAYGQTNAGKTHSLLGKPDRGIQGIISLALMHFLKDPNVLKVRLKAFEAFGQRTTKIPIYDLLDPSNDTEVWDEKVGKTTFNFTNTTTRVITSNIEAIEAVRFAQKNSHYAPTGKNAESSRGHVAFVVDILSKGELGSATADITTRLASLVFCDLAGSEGETALGPEFKQTVGLDIYDQRRMEAGVINMGLSDLQMFFQELKNKGKVGEVDGQGLRNMLKQYVDDDSNYVSVLFCVSPDPQNANSTESTLKFAEKVCQIKVKPKQCKSRTNWKKLALRTKQENEKLQRDIEQLKAQLKPEKRRSRSSRDFRPVIRTIATFADLKSELVLGQNIKSTYRMLKVQQGIGMDIPCEQRLTNQAVPGITIPCSRDEFEEYREGIQEGYFTTTYGPETCNDGAGENPKSEVATDTGEHDLALTSDDQNVDTLFSLVSISATVALPESRPRCHSMYFLDEFDERHSRSHRRRNTIDLSGPELATTTRMIYGKIYENEFGERLRKEERARRHTAKTRRSHLSRRSKARLGNSKKRAGPESLSRLNCGFFMV